MITLRNVTSPPEGSILSGLDAVSLSIDRGEIVSVVGVSDVARRRLLGVLGLHSGDWSGEYRLFGHDVHDLDDDERASLRGEIVGAMTRATPLVDCLSVEENLEIPLSYRGVPAAERGERIDEVLARLGVESIRAHEVESLPADQLQLVGIAKALVSSPLLVLLEEPTRNLSALQIRIVRREIDRIREGGCIVVQSHDRVEAGLAADRVIELDGRRPEPRARRSASSPRVRMSSVIGAW